MKPVIIYSIQRTRSTATLYSCKRDIKIREPFNSGQMFKNLNHIYCDLHRSKFHKIFVDISGWDNLIIRMNNANTVTKILSYNLYTFLPSRKWFEDTVNDETHDIFVLERENREELLLSWIIAQYFGHSHQVESESYEFTVPESMLHNIIHSVDQFLRFYPKKGQVITYENLPSSHFDKNLNQRMIDQDSKSKYKYFKNIDVFRNHIRHILDYYKDEWDSKIRSLNNGKLL